MKVLVATDGSEASIDAVHRALPVLAQDASYVLVSVVAPSVDPNEGTGGFGGPVVTPEEAADEFRAEVVAADAALALTAGAFGPVPIEQRVIEGSPGEAICSLAADEQVAVIVLGAQGKSLVARAVLGSVSSYVATHAPCPVLVVPPGP